MCIDIEYTYSRVCLWVCVKRVRECVNMCVCMRVCARVCLISSGSNYVLSPLPSPPPPSLFRFFPSPTGVKLSETVSSLTSVAFLPWIPLSLVSFSCSAVPASSSRLLLTAPPPPPPRRRNALDVTTPANRDDTSKHVESFLASPGAPLSLVPLSLSSPLFLSRFSSLIYFCKYRFAMYNTV